METIETIARAVILDKIGGKILLCATKNKNHYYLPGGHIEFGESAAGALSRELLEETGRKTDSAQFSFAGASENVFTEEGEEHHEINLFFHVNGIFSSDEKVASKEDHILFEWVSLADLQRFPVLPKSLPLMFKEWSEGKEILWRSIKNEKHI